MRKNNISASFYLLLLACIVLSIQVLASSVDSIQKRIQSSEGTEKINLLLELSNYYMSHLPTRTIEVASEALELAKKENDKGLEADALYAIGDGYRLLGENIKALDYFLQTFKIYNDLSNKEGAAKCANNIGRIYRFLGNFPTALEYHLNAMNVYRNLDNNVGMATSLINAGVVYRNLGQDEIAIKNYHEALSLSRTTNDKENMVYALLSLGNVYWYDGQNDKALNYYEDALSISLEEGFEGDSPAGIINNIGNVYRKKEQYDKALMYYRQSLDLSQSLGDKNLISITFKNMGIAYKESGQLSQAIEFFNKSKDLAQQIHLLRIIRETLDQLSQTYTLLADYKKALEYFIEFSKLNDSLFDKETSDKISMLQLKYAMKETEQENTIEAKDLELRISKVKNTRNIIIFFTLLAISFALILLSRYRLKTKSNEELRLLNAELERRVEDRTKQLREENEHRRIAQEQAELANETKNRFLATISHEVRTPINAIIGFCDLTIKSDIDSEHQLNLKRVKDSSEHLLALIKDILDYSQIESGQMVLKESTFDVAKLVESVVNAFYLDAISKEIKLSHEIAQNIPKFVIGDPDALRQVLYNLIGNAVKFTDMGEVKIEVKLDENNQNEENVRIVFSIKDTGIGISKLKQKLVFLDFTQGDSSSNRKYGGAGLGLTISKYFVELMNGKILVESEKGKGSNFNFSVELKVDKTKSVPTNIDTESVKKSLHLLIAEDNLLNSQVILAFLKRLGHTAKVAENGKIALGMLAEEDYDAVLMDIEMPVMDGIEATKEVRKGVDNIKNPKIPIIALTAHALKDYEEKSFEAGMDSYLTKPVDIDKLSEVLKKL